MRLAEIFMCVAIFLLSSSAFLSSIVVVRKSAGKVVFVSRNVSAVIKADSFLRNEIKNIYVPYWRSLKKQEEIYSEKMGLLGVEKGLEIMAVELVYDDDYHSEGVRVRWRLGGKDYETQEFVKQRIVDENE